MIGANVNTTLRIAFTGLSITLSFAVFSAEPGRPRMNEDRTDAGTLRVEPDTATAGEFGTWEVHYTVGADGIAEGGGIRVQMPDAFHAGPRNSANRLQATAPADDHYVTAISSNGDATIRAIVEHESEHELVKHPKPSLDGRYERYVFVVRAFVEQGQLHEGDTITVTYGDQTEGSNGYRAGVVSTPELPVLLALDGSGDGAFEPHANPASIRILPGPPASMVLHGRSQAVVNERTTMRVALIDKENNPVHGAAMVRIRAREGTAETPKAVSVRGGRGFAAFQVVPKAPGILRLTATSGDGELTAHSNPVAVKEEAPFLQILWGDLHSHTSFSWDGVGYGPFVYARNVSGLDFYTMTDHAFAVTDRGARGLNEDTWPAYAELVDAHNVPPSFVTLHAYECSFGGPWGHHNVYFRNEPAPLVYPRQASLPELWDMLEEGNALTIPHHTGKFPRGIQFTPQNSELRRNFEIYSGHGLSEVYNPDHPLAFENSTFTSDSRSLDEPSHAQDVWAQGLRLSTVAASDDHRAQPGKPYYGLTAVYAPRNSRNDVFQALYDRRTYGTTGAKIILDFTMNGEPMGSVVEDPGEATFRLHAIGTDTIETVELLRHRPGEEKFRVVQSWSPGGMSFEEEFTDGEYSDGSTYYMRLRQSNTVGGRIVMGWSSPIWTTKNQEPQ